MNWEEKVASFNQNLHEWNTEGHKYFDLRFAYEKIVRKELEIHEKEDPTCKHEPQEKGG